MKRHMLIHFFIFILVNKEKIRDNYKIKVVIKKGERVLLRNLILKILLRKKCN
jgi:hypothetical protein